MGYWMCRTCTSDKNEFIVQYTNYNYYVVKFDENGAEIRISSETPEWFEEHVPEDIFSKSVPFVCLTCKAAGIDNFKWIKSEDDFIHA